MRTGGLRVQGMATFAYGIATAYRPALLARPAGLVDAYGEVTPHTALVLRSMAWRDAAVGLAMVLAPQGPALSAAAAVRVASDMGDALFFGRALRGRLRRAGAVVSALGWAAVTVAGLAAGPGRPVRA
ncbi:hypothetical protein [Streptomyces longwoodensis]|uniref:hypothetical protein n=1 Tax=Streptomyces longwoodensis TaxID=68231 RepID=UPI0036FBCA4D